MLSLLFEARKELGVEVWIYQIYKFQAWKFKGDSLPSLNPQHDHEKSRPMEKEIPIENPTIFREYVSSRECTLPTSRCSLTLESLVLRHNEVMSGPAGEAWLVESGENFSSQRSNVWYMMNLSNQETSKKRCLTWIWHNMILVYRCILYLIVTLRHSMIVT